ncbi:MAG: glycerol-3-phosphate acyltransferase, partial [Burkholderiales bacterium]|nr:glycerol-3-phosphate acyltransferase [Opitutaceae bacterium]
MFLPLLLAAVVGYLLGALPFGWLISRKFGINIFEHGSKNPGATNVKRVLGEKFGKRGKRAGDVAFTLDALKGAAAAGWPVFIGGEHIVAMQLTGLVFALIGHSFSCWTRFKGGKGVATTAGGLLVLLPLPTVFAVIAWIATFYASRYVSLASIVSAVVLPLSAWLVPGVPC